jgi:hypothetical protein
MRVGTDTQLKGIRSEHRTTTDNEGRGNYALTNASQAVVGSFSRMCIPRGTVAMGLAARAREVGALATPFSLAALSSLY